MEGEMSEVIEQLLDARERRMQQKLTMVASGYHLVSLQLNIPGWPKKTNALTQFIKGVDCSFQRFFKVRHMLMNWREKHFVSDESGDGVYYLFNHDEVRAHTLKLITEEFESSFELGRIVDLDVMDVNGLPVSSGKAKKCFICDNEAEVCRKIRAHDVEEVREAMLLTIDHWLIRTNQKEMVQKLSGFVTEAWLTEVGLTPKPGLVCRNSPGSHRDMDYATFIRSIAALSPYLTEIGKIGFAFKEDDLSKALPIIREVGLKMEEAMNDTTNRVNTHKGGIFLMVVSIFSVIQVLKKKGRFKAGAFSAVVQGLTHGMVQRELCPVEKNMNLTHGQHCFLNYGLQGAGARGEVEQGLPTVLHHALPELSQRLEGGIKELKDDQLNEVLIPVLLRIMSVNNDTNVLYRHGKVELENLKQRALLALQEWDNGNKRVYQELVEWCNQQRISPGGCADLLAITLFLNSCKVEFSKKR